MEQRAKPKFPMRVNRYLALEGYCTRREADTLIEKGRVLINGERAVLGDKVGERDKVEVINRGGRGDQPRVYFAYYKAIGEVTGERNKAGLFPVGRLDKDSHGLLLLTNDGRITDRLLNPNQEHDKEYEVRVNKPITNHFLKIMSQGVEIEGYRTRPAEARQIDEKVFSIVLTEGKQHQIRRMCVALGYQVRDLKRVRIMNIKLDNLKPGERREIKGAELTTLLKKLGLG